MRASLDIRRPSLSASALGAIAARQGNLAAPVAPQPSWPGRQGPTPDTLRELTRWLAELGVDPKDGDPLAALEAAELSRGRVLDPRVQPAEMARAVARAKQALHLVPRRQTDLFAFSRLIDAKFELAPRTIEALAERVGRDALLLALDPKTPAPEPRAATGAELVAQMVRHLVHGGGASLEIRLEPSAAAWLEEALSASGVELKEAMGGAGAFCANLGAALPQVTSHFFSVEAIPPRVRERFSPNVSILGARGPAAPARVNYAGQIFAGSFSLFGADTVTIDGRPTKLQIDGQGRMIFGTPGLQDASFAGLSPSELEETAAGHDLLFLAGPHYHTLDADEGRSRALAAELERMRRANPKLFVHLEYVVPKVPKNEMRVFDALKGRIDSMSLNSVELPALLDRMHRHSLTDWTGDAHPRRVDAEEPGAIAGEAMHLKSALGLARVHIHGEKGDLLIADGIQDPDRQVLALLRARQIGTIKAANPSGEIKAKGDLWPVAPVVTGAGLAAVHAFADAMAARFPGIDARARAKIVERWWYRDPSSGTMYAFVPTRGIHDRSGGTVGLGDTIDAAALIYGREGDRPAAPLHASAFTRVRARRLGITATTPTAPDSW